MIEPNEYVLAIGAGLYAGTSQDLPAGTYVIGGGIEADMVFMGEGLAPRHAIVAINGHEARVEALADGVSIAGCGTLRVGRAMTVALPFELSIAALRMSWSRAACKSDTILTASLAASRGLRRLSGVRLRSAAALGVAAVTVAVITSNIVAAGSGPAGHFVDMGPHLATGTAATETGGSARLGLAAQMSAPTGAAINDAAEQLKSEVERAGLLNVTVGASSGVVMAQGTVEPGVVGQWQNVQQWFDERFKGEVVLVNGVAVKAEKVPSSLAIEGVWRGPQSHLVIRGQKYLEGAMLDDGWTIQRIEAERVVLKRDGRLVAVRY